MIAVSGASGFLGSYIVCMLLQEGKMVRALRRASSSMLEFEAIFQYYFQQTSEADLAEIKKRLQWIEADVNDIPSLERALDGVTTVYHAAAMVSFIQKDKDRLMQVNVEGTANMVNISLLKGVQQFCHVSSIAALGRSNNQEPITENEKWTESKFNSNYAISKYKAEKEVWRAAEEGLNVVIVNPGVILGVGDWNKGSCKLFQMVWKGMPFYTHGINGYVDVQDVARAMIYLTEQKAYQERFVLVSENMNMFDYLTQVAKLMNKKPPTIKVNYLIAQLAWMVDGLRCALVGKKPALTRETARASLKQFYYSSKKIKSKYNFEFTPMDQTIKMTTLQFLKSIQ